MDISWLIYIEYRKIEGKWKRQIVYMSMIDSDRKREKEGEGGGEREREGERVWFRWNFISKKNR